MNKRNVLLGIDGVPYELMDDLSNKDVMPNFKELKKSFSLKLMRSSIPHISSVSWSSIITGKNAGEHGIYGFSELIENTYSMSYPNFNALKSKTFWEKNPDCKHIIMNVPFTYPARKLNGIHIAGFVALDLEKAVFPKELILELNELGYEIDIDVKLAKQQSKDKFFDELFRILDIRKKTMDFLWDKPNWENFLAVITGTDRLGHFLWNAYEDDSNKYHERFLNFFQKIDDIIGNINHRLKEGDTFIILSDHGMEQIKLNVNLNTLLEKQGLLNLTGDLKNYNRITKASKAFVLDPGRVYLNKIFKYPNGSVKAENEKELLEELKSIFYNLKYKNQKVIKEIHDKNDIYSGKMIDKAPDLVLIENKGFNLKASIGKENVFEEEKIFSGKHNQNAFLFINNEINLENPTVEDVVGLME